MRKEFWKSLARWSVICALILVLMGATFEYGNRALAQVTGYRFTANGLVFQGQNGGVFFEPSFNAGPDVSLQRLQANNIGFVLGGVNSGWAVVPPPPVVSLATATTGGTIPAGTSYRLALTYMTITGGENTIVAAQEATQTTTGSTSTITATAPIAAAGAAGYRIWSTNASGVGAGNATLTELLQPINATVCAGAFQVNGPAGIGTGPFVCPFGVNAVLTSLVTTAATVSTPNIPGTAPVFQPSGIAIPAANTAAYPAALPQLIANVINMPTLSTITTAQTFDTIPLTANVQNSIGKVLHITGHGRYTSGSQTGTMTIAVTEGGITPITIVAGPLVTGGQTNAQFQFDYYITTSLTGASGTVWGHGQLCVNLATASNTSALSCFNDTSTAVSSAIALNAANSLATTIAMSTSTTSATLDDEKVLLEN